jgi:hypothetical protein
MDASGNVTEVSLTAAQLGTTLPAITVWLATIS